MKLIDVKEIVNKYKDLGLFKVEEDRESITVKFSKYQYFKFLFDSNNKIKLVYIGVIGDEYFGETPMHFSAVLKSLEIKCEIERRYKLKIS
jgi:hypothetical protein